MKLVKSAILVAATVAVGCVFAETHTIADLANHASAINALRVKTGDTITLPELGEGSYKAINTRIVSIDGNIATVLMPGIVGIQQLDASDALVAVAAVLSVPDPIGAGHVYLFSEGKNGSWIESTWTDLTGSLEGAPTDGYPHLADDIAIIANYNGYGMELDISEDISLGGFMIGAYCFDKGMEGYRYRFRGPDGSVTNTLKFARTDRKSPWIQLCPGANLIGTVTKNYIQFGDDSRPLEIACDGDVVCDLGWDGLDEKSCRSLISFNKDSTLNVPAGSSLTFFNSSPRNDGQQFSNIEGFGTLLGAGRIDNNSRGSFRADFNASGFSGLIVESSLGRGTDRNGGLWFFDSDSFGNAALQIDGFAFRTSYKDWSTFDGAGYVRIGTNHGYGDQQHIVGNRLPGREVILNGGYLDLLPERSNDKPAGIYQWYEGSILSNCTEVLNANSGYTRITVVGVDPTNEATWPTNYVCFNSIVHTNKATVTIGDSFVQSSETKRYRCETHLPSFSDVAIGGGQSPTESPCYSIIPWLVAEQNTPNGSWTDVGFAAVDADGRLRHVTRANQSPYNAFMEYGPTVNAYNENNSLKFPDGVTEITVNSLVLRQEYNDFEKKFGNGCTLTITSGGLILNAKKACIGSSTGGDANGSLVFGDTAYVFGNSPASNEPCQIWAPMTASKGFVSAMGGYLLIGGDQRGIDDEIVVNNGTLYLGSLDGTKNCLIDVPVRIVGGGSVLKINFKGEPTLDPKQNVYFDDIGGHAGKLVIPEGSVEKCNKCYVSGVTIPRGTWGATGSGADNIDDEHFSGSGMLVVKTDELAHPLVIKIR